MKTIKVTHPSVFVKVGKEVKKLAIGEQKLADATAEDLLKKGLAIDPAALEAKAASDAEALAALQAQDKALMDAKKAEKAEADALAAAAKAEKESETSAA